MKFKIIKLLMIALFLALIWGRCDKDNGIPSGGENPPEELKPLKDGILPIVSMNCTACKDNTKSAGEEPQYVELKAVGPGQLSVKFVNAHFSCCTDSIHTSAVIADDTVRIAFWEDWPPQCFCICYRDVECIIGSLQAREYSTAFMAQGEVPNAVFAFTYSETLDTIINLTLPEVVAIPPMEDRILPILETISSGCKSDIKSAEATKSVELKSVGPGQLSVTFNNAHLSCCPDSVFSYVYIREDTLRVNFAMTGKFGCFCLCDYDLTSIVYSLEAREYPTIVNAWTNGEAIFTFTYSDDLDTVINISGNP